MTTDDILRMAREAGKYADDEYARRWETGEGGSWSQIRDERFAALVAAAERKRWRRIAENAQAVTDGCEDKIDYFKVPSHLMAALALALDEGPSEAAIRARGTK